VLAFVHASLLGSMKGSERKSIKSSSFAIEKPESAYHKTPEAAGSTHRVGFLKLGAGRIANLPDLLRISS